MSLASYLDSCLRREDFCCNNITCSRLMGKNETGSQRNIWREYPPLEGQEENPYDRFKKKNSHTFKRNRLQQGAYPDRGVSRWPTRACGASSCPRFVLWRPVSTCPRPVFKISLAQNASK